MHFLKSEGAQYGSKSKRAGEGKLEKTWISSEFGHSILRILSFISLTVSVVPWSRKSHEKAVVSFAQDFSVSFSFERTQNLQMAKRTRRSGEAVKQ